jgi:hypothetical protein
LSNNAKQLKKNNPNSLGFDETKILGHELTLEVLLAKKPHIVLSEKESKASKFYTVDFHRNNC